MKKRPRIISSVAAIIGIGLALVAQGQTPLPKTTPQLTMRWLNSLTVSPTTVPAGTELTGTIILLRPAVSSLTVGLALSGATPVEGNIWVADGAIMQSSVTVPARSDRATFTITTSKPTSTTGSKTFTVTGSYAAERVSASFTTTQLIRPKLP